MKTMIIYAILKNTLKRKYGFERYSGSRIYRSLWSCKWFYVAPGSMPNYITFAALTSTYCLTHTLGLFPLFFCSDGCSHTECLKHCISHFTTCYFHAQFNPVLLKIATILVQNLLNLLVFSTSVLQESKRYSDWLYLLHFVFLPINQNRAGCTKCGVYSLIDVELYRDLWTRLPSCSLHSVLCKALRWKGFSNIPVHESVL